MAMMSPWCPSTSSIFLDHAPMCVLHTREKTKIINKEKEDQYTELQRL